MITCDSIVDYHIEKRILGVLSNASGVLVLLRFSLDLVLERDSLLLRV